MTSACAMVDAPQARNASIPSPTMAKQREAAINERPDSVMYLPLGEDVLVPEILDDGSFPQEVVGPYEFRGETLASALQMILADYDLSLAFETQEGLTRRITVSNLRGDLGKVINQICSLANLYCSYEDGGVTVKDTQTFTVTLPPIGADDETDYLDNVSAGLAAIIGGEVPAPIIDPTTRTIVYSATQRTSDIATRYFQRLRANTAMIVFETYIWEVSLNSGNSTGVNWDKIGSFGKFNTAFDVAGTVATDFTNPISIGIPTTQDIAGTPTDFIEFLSQFGAVKTISQPQITVLSGSSAELRVADTQNYVSEIATTLSGDQSTTSVSTDSVDTGFTLTIGSSWDKSTVYANVEIELTDVKQIDDFSFSDDGEEGGSTSIQLPQTSERQLTTQIRVRPGDSVLIGGLVRENDNFDKAGIGMMEPILPTSRTTQAENLELVIMLRPRVVIYTASNDKRYVDFANKKHKLPGTGVEKSSPNVSLAPASPEFGNVYAAPSAAVTSAPTPPPIPLSSPEPLSSPPPPEVPAAMLGNDLVPASAIPATTLAPTPMPMVAPAPLPVVPAAPLSTSYASPSPEPVAPVNPAPVEPASASRFGSGYVSRSTSYDAQPYAPSAPSAPAVYEPPSEYQAPDVSSYNAVPPQPEEDLSPVYYEDAGQEPASAPASVYPLSDYPAAGNDSAVSASDEYGMPSPAVPVME